MPSSTSPTSDSIPTEPAEDNPQAAEAQLSEIEPEAPISENGATEQSSAQLQAPATITRRKRSTSPATEPLDPNVLAPTRSAPGTKPLQEDEAARLPLQAGALVGDRYEVEQLISNSPQANVYRVADTQGYKRCWACGSTLSRQGDVYCADCGAELSGKRYRLQEFFTPPQQNGDNPTLALPLPAPILANRIPGLLQVYDILADPLGEGRVYIAWEESYGRTLASYIPDTVALSPDPTTDDSADPDTQPSPLSPQSSEEASEEQIAAWMAQSAEVLAQLHAEGVVGCRMTLDNLLVQPGDRVMLLDPDGCREAPTDPDEASREHLSDVRLLAGELEKWYIAVRDVGGILGNLAASHDAVQDEEGEGMLRLRGAVFSASDLTGPLAAVLNPVFVLSRAREGDYPTAAALAEALHDLYEQAKPLTNLTLWSGRASDVGQVRQINEDSLVTLEATVLEHEGNLPIALYVIADGMGGHQSGEVASSIAARTVGAVVNSSLIGPVVAGDPVARDETTCAQLLRQGILEANRRIAELARERHSDLGTTVVAALVIGNQLTVANVGDSRAYLLREGALSPLTTDHSLVMQLVLAGQIEHDDIYTHPRRNEIYRALGDPRITEEEVDIYTHRLMPGDGLLLCSDGLWDFVRDPAIQGILVQDGADPQTLSDALVAEANRQGGEDNVSVVYARVMSLGD